jgi:hypothetical protein
MLSPSREGPLDAMDEVDAAFRGTETTWLVVIHLAFVPARR